MIEGRDGGEIPHDGDGENDDQWCDGGTLGGQTGSESSQKEKKKWISVRGRKGESSKDQFLPRQTYGETDLHQDAETSPVLHQDAETSPV
jgi:hypothetical protein